MALGLWAVLQNGLPSSLGPCSRKLYVSKHPKKSSRLGVYCLVKSRKCMNTLLQLLSGAEKPSARLSIMEFEFAYLVCRMGAPQVALFMLLMIGLQLWPRVRLDWKGSIYITAYWAPAVWLNAVFRACKLIISVGKAAQRNCLGDDALSLARVFRWTQGLPHGTNPSNTICWQLSDFEHRGVNVYSGPNGFWHLG